MPQITRDTGQIAAVFVECIFYGVYLVTFATSLRTIALTRPELPWTARFTHQRPKLIVVLLLFTFSTLNLALGLPRVLAAIHHSVDFAGFGTNGAGQLGQDWVNILKVPFSPVAIAWFRALRPSRDACSPSVLTYRQ